MKAIKRRIKQLRIHCHPLMRPVHPSQRAEVFKRVTVSQTHRYVYFRIPKAANSTIARTLASYEHADAYDPQADASGRAAKDAFEGLGATGCLLPHTLAQRYFLFTVVRNPFTRVLSAYLDKVRYREAAGYEWVAQAARAPSPNDVTFAQFVDVLEAGALHANPHWCPQTRLIPAGVRRLHWLGHVETLEQDMRHVVQHVFGPDKWLGLTTRSHNQRSASKALHEHYDDQLVERITQLYFDDFEQLGYTPGSLEQLAPDAALY